jgi:hypothetical protein
LLPFFWRLSQQWLILDLFSLPNANIHHTITANSNLLLIFTAISYVNKNFMKRKIALFALAALVLIQFIHPSKNDSKDTTNDITKFTAVPDNVMKTFKTACFDCHSNNTDYPWYTKIQPVDWWLNDHIKDGKRHFNFNEFNAYRAAKKYKKLEEISKEIEEGGMPMGSYTWIHKDAILNDTQKKEVYAWVKSVRDTMAVHFPKDSLEFKGKQGPPR